MEMGSAAQTRCLIFYAFLAHLGSGKETLTICGSLSIPTGAEKTGNSSPKRLCPSATGQ